MFVMVLLVFFFMIQEAISILHMFIRSLKVLNLIRRETILDEKIRMVYMYR